MGENAEDCVSGRCCELCGIYFIEPHGYPVVCEDCWQYMTKKERSISQKATKKEKGHE